MTNVSAVEKMAELMQQMEENSPRVAALQYCLSQKKRAQLNGQAHQQKPDKDNLEKALLDAIFDDDSRVWDGRVTKLWGEKGQIIIGECAP